MSSVGKGREKGERPVFRRKRPSADVKEGLERLACFLRDESDARLFRHPIGHPSRPTGFCFYEHSLRRTAQICLRAWYMEMVFRLPFSRPKLRLLRRHGAKVGQHVVISASAWVDPVFPQLLTVEDDVFIGMGARVFTHEFRRDEFRAGRVIIRKGAFIGAYAVIGCGVEIGEDATVAAGAMVADDVPAGCTVIGNPPRIVRRAKEAPQTPPEKEG